MRAQQGGKPITVKARKGVVLTCGGFENNQEMIRTYLPGVPYCYTSGSPYNEGDGIKMAMTVGADLWHMNNYAGPSMALKVPEIPTSLVDAGPALQQGRARRHDRRRPGRAALHRREIQDAPRQGAAQRPLDAAADAVPDVHDHRPRAFLGGPPLRQARPATAGRRSSRRYQWSEDNSAEVAKGWVKTSRQPRRRSPA